MLDAARISLFQGTHYRTGSRRNPCINGQPFCYSRSAGYGRRALAGFTYHEIGFVLQHHFGGIGDSVGWNYRCMGDTGNLLKIRLR